ncbi:MAG: flagellin [Pseudomonadota bacterium]
MAMVINTNVMSLNSQRNLNSTQNSLATSMERLSSGLRINSAKDDAAGLGITDRMTSQIRGLNQAVRNSNDAISLSQTAEGAMQESSNILQRMRELAVQSANDSNSASDRASLQKEVNQLQQELDRITDTTTFNGKKLLDGSFSSAQFQVGANASETISVSIGNVSANSIGNNTVDSYSAAGTINEANAAAVNNVVAQTLTLSGAFGVGTASVGISDSAKDITAAVNSQSEDSGVSATAVTYAKLDGLGADDTVSFTLTGSDSATVSASITQTDYSNLADSINAVAGQTGVTATLSDDKASILLESSSGEDIKISAFDAGVATTDLDITGLQEDATTEVGTAVTLIETTPGTTDLATVGGVVSFNSTKAFTVASDTGTTLINTSAASAQENVTSVDISTVGGSNDAISIIDGALAAISDTRADMGAIQNRLSSTIANISNISENVSAARSRVQDADFAAETANLTRAQIMQQAGVAMLSQANSQPQMVLSLLQ